MNWTKEQARAIEARSGNLLLSAAAGSGKTTVLVERVLRLILEDGAQIDRMLVVTFTRAAAADMRAKLSEKLMEKAAQGDQRCREQLLLLERALITTLHAFCADFLRTHFEAAGVDPAFRIMDDAQRQQLMDRALDEVMEEAYEAGGEALMALDYGRGPKEVRALTEAMCRVLEERPDPSAWLSRMTGGGSAQMGLWMEELVISARRTMAEARILLTQALAVPGCPAHYAVPIERDLEQLEQLERLAETEQYDSLRQALEEFKPARVGGGKRSDVDEAALETVKKLRERARDALKSVKLLEHPSAQAVRDMEIVAGQIATLGKLAESVAARLEEKKDEQSGLTYADLERRTLLALQDDDTAEELRRRFDHVFIDEYQDTSDIQEAIVSRLCREDNRFMVGDVKQSIYRFRMAEPGLFIEKYRRYREGEGGTLLPLTRNFRSCKAVLDFVNMVFERVMTGGDAEVVYDELARLNPGRDDSTPGVPVQIHLLEQASAEETDEAIAEMKNAEREGLLIARRIRQLMAEDAGLRYRDFAILTRAKASAFTPMLPMLLAENIPAYADGGTGYYESMEVLLALSMLKLMANGRSDVELIGVLHSPVAGLNADALAQIRIAFRDMPYVDAARRYAQEKGDALARRLQEFFRKLDLWRLQTGVVSLGMLVRSVLEESGLYVYVGALPGGAQRQANLDRLAMEAERFDREVSGSVVRFLEHTRRIREKGDGDAAHLLGENDDVVRMMTVHRSKGLEFRVVFGALLGKRYGG
ncbi:MAG: UvrD-helicase domain-containing protein, partial [Christensenellales bacterium]|nr:UvrD-helicase domain-containing protein [Christensenellales bacterium]